MPDVDLRVWSPWSPPVNGRCVQHGLPTNTASLCERCTGQFIFDPETITVNKDGSFERRPARTFQMEAPRV